MTVPAPERERRGRLTRLQKVSAATGAAAAVGVSALALTVPGHDARGQRTTDARTANVAAGPVAWQTAVDSSDAQKSSISAQSANAGDRATAQAKARAERKARAEAAAAKREAAAEKAREQARERAQAASRSAARTDGPAAPSGSPQQIARQIIGDEAEFQCFSNIVSRESGWNVHAQNPSGAYGLVQALPGSKMASAGPDWRNDAATQIKWGLDYMKSHYGSACGAWSFWQAHNWY